MAGRSDINGTAYCRGADPFTESGPATSLVLVGACCHPRAARAVRSDFVTPLPAPTYIPAEVCSAVGLPIATPLDTCMAAVQADVAGNGVAAPAADAPGLQEVVAGAWDRGVDLKVVVMEQSPPIDTPLRDIATQVGQQNPGSTVLVLSPGWAGSYSPIYDRVLLEAGQDVAKLAPNPVQGAQNFVDQLDTPDFGWMAFTIGLVLAVSGAAVVTRLLQRWAKRRGTTID